MKKLVVLLGLLCVGSGAPHLLNARPASTSTTASSYLTYADGQADGTDYAASLAAQYGYGSQDYTDALNAEEARAYYNATHSEEPTYWRGYRNALVKY